MDGTQQGNDNEPSRQFQPGETISPRTESAAPEPSPTTVEPVSSIPNPPQAAPQQPVPPPAAPIESAAPAPQEPAALPETFAAESPQPATWQGSQAEPITWTASEYVAHSKTPGWHTLLVVGAVVLAVIVWFFTKDIVSPVVIIIAGVVLSMYGGRQPKELQYQLDDHGINIGGRQFSFGEFRAFSVVQEGGAFDSLALIPTKRFLPLTTVYYDPADEERILNVVGSYLPHMERKADAIDVLMRRLRF